MNNKIGMLVQSELPLFFNNLQIVNLFKLFYL